MTKICTYCEKEFTKPHTCSKSEWGGRRFCSKSCADSCKRGKPSVSPETTFKSGHMIYSLSDPRKKQYGSNNNKWKGGKVKKECLVCKSVFFVFPYRISSAKVCSKPCLLQFHSFPEWRNKTSETHKKRVAKGLHNSYRGGVTPVHKAERLSLRFKLWREAVFKRDDYTCQKCGIRGGELHPHHVQSFAYYPELRFELSNGMTLCASCHRKTETWGQRIKVNALQSNNALICSTSI